MTDVTDAANTGPYQCFADNVRADSSALWVITVRDPCKCYVEIMNYEFKKGNRDQSPQK